MQAGPDVTTRAANHTISALFARSFAQVPGRQPPAAVSANSTILLQDGGLGWKRHCRVFFPDSDLHILNHFKNALIIDGSCDDHRTRISYGAQVSFSRGMWSENPHEHPAPWMGGDRASFESGWLQTRLGLYQRGPQGRHMSLTQPEVLSSCGTSFFLLVSPENFKAGARV